MTLYGIKNCDTVKKARKWLEQNNINYQFHDFRADGLDKKKLTEWIKTLGWEALLNKRGTTYRQLSDASKENLTQAKALKLMLEYPALIKRPILDFSSKTYIGYSEAEYYTLLKTT